MDLARFFEIIKNYKCIMIFGAKWDAHNTYEAITAKGFEAECYVVSSREGNISLLDGKPVRHLNEISEKNKQEGLIIVSQRHGLADEMKALLSKEGFQNIITRPYQFVTPMTEKQKKYLMSDNICSAKDFCETHPAKKDDNIGICIYVVTSHANLHKGEKKFESKYSKYIQAGAKISDKRMEECEFSDDTGDNISELNGYFCELTAGYWIYKNDCVNDYVGFYHYSRGMDLTDEEVETIAASHVDLVLPFPYMCRYRWKDTLNAVAATRTRILQSLKNIKPEYICAAESFYDNKLFYAGNVLFARKDVFCHYYEWLFAVLKECQKIAEEKQEIIFKREWGYYGEILLNIYVNYHVSEYDRVLYADMKALC